MPSYVWDEFVISMNEILFSVRTNEYFCVCVGGWLRIIFNSLYCVNRMLLRSHQPIFLVNAVNKCVIIGGLMKFMAFILLLHFTRNRELRLSKSFSTSTCYSNSINAFEFFDLNGNGKHFHKSVSLFTHCNNLRQLIPCNALD